jgi:phosphate transport system protein
MASDLRFATQTLTTVADRARIADLAVNVCERAIDLAPKPAPSPYVDIPRMADLVQGMVRDAIDAFIEGDEAKADAVRRADDEVDDLYRRVFAHVLELMRDDAVDIHAGIHIQSIAKYLERIGDHGTNLAEEVLFMMRGRDVRHEGKL